jgi:peptide-methionine (S)-S-oxide reductase
MPIPPMPRVAAISFACLCLLALPSCTGGADTAEPASPAANASEMPTPRPEDTPGGTADNPTYEQVCSGSTGHAEVVRVRFDEAKIDYRDLLDWFLKAHDPTTLNRQGNDYGTQYRSVIFVADPAQRAVAEQAVQAANAALGGRVVTQIAAMAMFWKAEDYHQDYFARNPSQPYCLATIPPKLKKLGLDKK